MIMMVAMDIPTPTTCRACKDPIPLTQFEVGNLGLFCQTCTAAIRRIDPTIGIIWHNHVDRYPTVVHPRPVRDPQTSLPGPGLTLADVADDRARRAYERWGKSQRP